MNATSVPLAVRFRKGLHRLVDLDTNGIATTSTGKPLDKGGGKTEADRARLAKQAQAVNISKQEERQRMVEAVHLAAKKLRAQRHKKRKRYG